MFVLRWNAEVRVRALPAIKNRLARPSAVATKELQRWIINEMVADMRKLPRRLECLRRFCQTRLWSENRFGMIYEPIDMPTIRCQYIQLQYCLVEWREERKKSASLLNFIKSLRLCLQTKIMGLCNFSFIKKAQSFSIREKFLGYFCHEPGWRAWNSKKLELCWRSSSRMKLPLGFRRLSTCISGLRTFNPPLPPASHLFQPSWAQLVHLSICLASLGGHQGGKF